MLVIFATVCFYWIRTRFEARPETAPPFIHVIRYPTRATTANNLKQHAAWAKTLCAQTFPKDDFLFTIRLCFPLHNLPDGCFRRARRNRYDELVPDLRAGVAIPFGVTDGVRRKHVAPSTWGTPGASRYQIGQQNSNQRKEHPGEACWAVGCTHVMLTLLRYTHQRASFCRGLYWAGQIVTAGDWSPAVVLR